ncbi:MAG: hypothetical protein V1919_00930 [Candidatus Omnitrophota bacterium]
MNGGDKEFKYVIPAEAGIQNCEDRMDSRLRGNDGEEDKIERV